MRGVTLDLATIPGDGVEPDVVEQALCALRTTAHAEGGAEVRVTEYPFGAGLPRDRAHPRRRRPRRARSRHSDETVAFALDGARYEIDLSAKNATTLRKALQPFVDHARAVKPAVLTAAPRRGRGRRAADVASRRAEQELVIN
jgi:hypothetical protein